MKALEYFATQGPEGSSYMQKVLLVIKANNLLPPLQVVNIVSQSPNATLGMVKEYLKSCLSAEQKEIQGYMEDIKSKQTEIDQFEKKIQALKSDVKRFEKRKCTKCTLDLEPVSVHFLCEHSYHLTCIGENERQCLECAKEGVPLLSMEKAQQSRENYSNNNEDFFKRLENKPEFSTVAAFFKDGVFKPRRTNAPKKKATPVFKEKPFANFAKKEDLDRILQGIE